MEELDVNIHIARNKLWSMAQIVQRALERSICSLLEKNVSIAKSVIEEDKTINAFEIEIDNIAFCILSNQADNVSSDDVRAILSVQKINPMLERIGDHAVNIAESAETLSSEISSDYILEIQSMAFKCKEIIRDALNSLFECDIILANDVLTRDDEIDRLNVSITSEIKAAVLNGYANLSFETAIEIIRICKNLERIADLGSNIAEEALYSILGKVVKHQTIINE